MVRWGAGARAAAAESHLRGSTTLGDVILEDERLAHLCIRGAGGALMKTYKSIPLNLQQVAGLRSGLNNKDCESAADTSTN